VPPAGEPLELAELEFEVSLLGGQGGDAEDDDGAPAEVGAGLLLCNHWHVHGNAAFPTSRSQLVLAGPHRQPCP
jgi:hypothetical protein